MRYRIAVNTTIAKSDPPNRAVLVMRANDKLGSVETNVTLYRDAIDEGTALNYSAHAKLDGQLNRFAAHARHNAAEELVGVFFQRFAAAVPPDRAIPQTEPPVAIAEQVTIARDAAPATHKKAL